MLEVHAILHRQRCNENMTEKTGTLSDAYKSNTALFVMPSLFRLSYSTGMRVSEAIRLKKDVDIKGHRVLLFETKNDYERYASLCESMEKVLTQYLHYCNKLNIQGVSLPDHLFFVKNNGTGVSNFSVGYFFRHILEKVGIPVIGRKALEFTIYVTLKQYMHWQRWLRKIQTYIQDLLYCQRLWDICLFLQLIHMYD